MENFLISMKAKKLTQKQLATCTQVHVGADGVWVTFKSKSGKSFTFQPAQEFGHGLCVKSGAVLDWCGDLQPLFGAADRGSKKGARRG